MPKVLVELSMSLDGYITGPGVSPQEPMGRGGEGLHVVPVVLGGGTRLFPDESPLELRLRRVDVASSPLATHLTYAVAAGEPVAS